MTVTKSVYQVDKWTLIARGGGLVGLGRNIYWVLTTFVIAALSSASLVMAKLFWADKERVETV